MTCVPGVTACRIFVFVLVVATLLVPSATAGAGFEDRVRYTASEARGMVAVDASDYHIDGTLKGGVSRRDGAYKFHSLSKGKHRYDRIRAPHDSALNPRSAPFEFGARVKVSRHAQWSHSEMAVVRHGDTDTEGGDYKLELVKKEDGAVSAFCVWHDSDGDGTGYVRGRGRLTTIANGNWHEITCGRVDRNTVSLTIDGHVTQRPVSGNLDTLVSTDPLLIGFHFRQNGTQRREQFVGLMDDIHVSVR